MYSYAPWVGDYRDPACPYDEDWTQEDEEAAYDDYVDRCVDERLERD